MNILKLHKAITKVALIVGVSIGNKNDKSTWRIDFQETATDAEKAAAQAVIDAADISILDDPVTVEPLAFLKRFTQSERIAIKASTDAQVQDFLLLITAAKDYIDLKDADVVNGIAYLMTLGLLTESRKTEILTP